MKSLQVRLPQATYIDWLTIDILRGYGRLKITVLLPRSLPVVSTTKIFTEEVWPGETGLRR